MGAPEENEDPSLGSRNGAARDGIGAGHDIAYTGAGPRRFTPASAALVGPCPRFVSARLRRD
ncbi:hypothetical protein CEJ63_21930, partial [Acinetobacter baumannii]